jgi:hypothetical protein
VAKSITVVTLAMERITARARGPVKKTTGDIVLKKETNTIMRRVDMTPRIQQNIVISQRFESKCKRNPKKIYGEIRTEQESLLIIHLDNHAEEGGKKVRHVCRPHGF